MKSVSVVDQKMETKVVWFVLGWALVAYYAGSLGLFTHFPAPMFGLMVVAIQVGIILTYVWKSAFREFSNSISLKTIALFHTWRIFAGWIFIAYSDHLPATFVNNAAYGDIISGFLGLSVFLLGHTKLNYYVFNGIGLLDFFIAVGTGLYLTTTGDTQMGSIIQLPLIMIPLFGVPLSGYTHFLAVAKLLKLKNVKWLERIQ